MDFVIFEAYKNLILKITYITICGYLHSYVAMQMCAGKPINKIFIPKLRRI